MRRLYFVFFFYIVLMSVWKPVPHSHVTCIFFQLNPILSFLPVWTAPWCLSKAPYPWTSPPVCWWTPLHILRKHHKSHKSMCVQGPDSLSLIYLTPSAFVCVEKWWIKLTVLQLWQHWFFSIHRGAFSNKQPLGQILLVKGLKNIFSYNDKTLFHQEQPHRGKNELKQVW